MTVTATDKGDLYELPNGTRLYYVDANHAYYRCKPDGSRGQRLTGVSTVCSPLDFRPDALLRWVEKLTLEGVARGFHGEPVPADPHVLRQRLESKELRWEQIRDQAAQRGTDVHALMLHALATGDDVPDLDELPPEQRGYGQAVMKWWLDRKPEVLEAEQVVLSEESGFAGRYDLRCVLHGGLEEGQTALVDLKTSGFVANKAHAQVAGYDLGAIESGISDGPSDVLLILQVAEDGTYQEVRSCATHEDFLAALAVYRAAGRIGNAARAARKGSSFATTRAGRKAAA